MPGGLRAAGVTRAVSLSDQPSPELDYRKLAATAIKWPTRMARLYMRTQVRGLKGINFRSREFQLSSTRKEPPSSSPASNFSLRSAEHRSPLRWRWQGAEEDANLRQSGQWRRPARGQWRRLARSHGARRATEKAALKRYSHAHCHRFGHTGNRSPNTAGIPAGILTRVRSG